MKIQAITPFKNNISNQNNTKNKNQFPIQNQNQTMPQLPTTAQYLAFTGGYSLDLASTVKNLDKLAERKGTSIYPPQIREWAGMILEEGNQAKETLVNIHKNFYASLKECFSLEEAKAKFPEFKDVKSDNDVRFGKGTFFESVKKGENEFFDKDDDLSLQILKLYWGEGFSLNDLKKYTNGKDIYYTMRKLNIPTVDKDYGHILKFSDPEYNERLTKEMTAKRLEALDKKTQAETGEPVFIKRGPLSEEHKKHISEGLQKYYQENPEALLSMSERQKEFYLNNPEKAQMLHKVLLKAWNVFGANKIKLAMSEFMKSKKVEVCKEEALFQPEKLTTQQSKIMKQFWSVNEWAKKSFSKNMKYAWKKVKEEQDMFYNVDITPNLFKKRFYIWAEKEGIDTTNLHFDTTKYYPHKPELNNDGSELKAISKYTPKYIASCSGDESAKIANTYQLALIEFGHHLKTIEKSNASQDTKMIAYAMRHIIHKSIFDSTNLIFGSPTAKVMDAQEVQEVYVKILTTLMNNHENKLISELNKLLNTVYQDLDKTWKPGTPLLLQPNAADF